MSRLTFPSPLLQNLSRELRERCDVETCAIAFTRKAGEKLVVTSYEVVPDDAYSKRERRSVAISPEHLVDIINRARADDLACVLIHTHPDDAGLPDFSRDDDKAEQRLRGLFEARLPRKAHAAMVMSPGGIRARILGTDTPVVVQEVGRRLAVADAPTTHVLDRHDRQIRAFGAEGQQRIGQLHVGVVGVGGTGSITIQELAHLGVKRFTLIDFDNVEETNLNRLLGGRHDDAGKPKLEVALRSLKAIDPDLEVITIDGDVADDAVAKRLIACDFIFLCTDSHASRAVVSQMAYQYLIPTIDQGVCISVRSGELAFVTGRVQLLAPELPCLTCMEFLNSEQVRREMLTPEARAADPYIVGVHEPHPSVISLNGTVASLAVTMFIAVVTGAPLETGLQIYDGKAGTVKSVNAGQDPQCFVCSPAGALARGDSWPLPTRS